MTTTTSTTTRPLSDAEYLAQYEHEVRSYVEWWTTQTELQRWHCYLSFGELGNYKDDTVRLDSEIRSYRRWLKHITGSATLYTLDAEGQRVEWQALRQVGA